MFFKKKNEKGYSVVVKGFDIFYSEDKYSARIGIEFVSKPVIMVIYFNEFHSWLPPHESEKITAETKDKIKNNIIREMKAEGQTIEWD